MSEEKTRDQNKFVVRMPDGLRERIGQAARSNNRSMNAEIVATLEEKYPAPTAEEETAMLVAFREYTSKYYTGDQKTDGLISQVILEKFLAAMLVPEKYKDLKGGHPGKQLADEIARELEKRGIHADGAS